MIESNIEGVTLKLQTGKTPPSKEEKYFNGDINWYTPADLKTKLLGRSKRTITELAHMDKKALIYPRGTVLLSCIGDIGKLGITTDDKSSSNQQITGLIPDTTKITSEYLYYWCLAHKYVFESKGTSVTVPMLNNKRLRKIKISYTESIDDQIKIANLLSQVEALIAKREESINLLDELLRSTFLDMFGKYKNFNYKSIEEIASSKKYSLSSGPFGSNLTSKHYKPRGVIVLRGKNITSGKIDLNDVKFISEEKAIELKRSEIYPDDIVVIAVGSSGYALRIPSSLHRAIISQNFNKITPNIKIISPIYLEYIINSNFVQQQFKKVMVNGGRSFLSLTSIKKIKIPLPPKPLQDKFSTIVQQVEESKKRYQESLNELHQLFGSLSQRAFKGELDLSGVR